MTNCTCRGGGLSQRLGYQQLVGMIPGAKGLFQGAFLYEPLGANPYLILSIGGVIWKVLVEAPYTITNLSAQFNLFNPSSVPKAFFAQGESFLVIQAGDYVTLPLFWDGTTLVRSRGLPPPPPAPTVFAMTQTAGWTTPDVGQTVVVDLSAPYPGAVGDNGYWALQSNNFVIGQFVVTAKGGNTVTLQTVSSQYVGSFNGVYPGLTNIYTFTLIAVPPPTPQLPAAGPMVYYQGRLWYAIGRIFTAGDIVGGPSGTLAYNFKDSILMVTENPLAIGGDGFAVPDNWISWPTTTSRWDRDRSTCSPGNRFTAAKFPSPGPTGSRRARATSP